MEKPKKKKRKKPPVQTKTYHSFVNGRYGDKYLTKEERDEILYPLGEYEYKGKGLPEGFKNIDDKCPHHIFSFDISVIHAEEDVLKLGFALKNSQTHIIKPYKDLSGKMSCCVKGDFERSLYKIIENTCFILAETCVKKHKGNFKEKKEFLEQVKEHFELQFKILLGLGQRKIVEEFVNDDGMKVEKSVFTDIGRRKGTNKPRKLSEKEIENQKARKLKILEAMRKATNIENKSEIAHIIGISRPTLRKWLESIGVSNDDKFIKLMRYALSGK